MSEQRQARDGGRRAPVRMARPTRRSASGPGDRVASARDIAIYFREDCRGLRDSLQLEMVVAQYLLRMHGVRTTADVPVGDALIAGVVAELERHGDELSRALLRTMAYLDADGAASGARHAAARLGHTGVGLPREFADVAEAGADAAYRVREGGRKGEYALFVDFSYGLSAAHSVAMFAVPRRGDQVVKHVALMAPTAELDLGEAFGAAPEAVEVETARELMRELLDRTYAGRMFDGEDFRVLIAAARARA